jgi:hypothetical protein
MVYNHAKQLGEKKKETDSTAETANKQSVGLLASR